MPQVGSHRDRQCHYAFKIHYISTETDERGLKRSQSVRIHFYLLKSKEVDDVHRATVVYEDSPSVEPFMSIITKGSSCGCVTLQASSYVNRMSLPILLCFRGGILWMPFTCICCDFLRDLNDPFVDGPLVIIFISFIVFYG